MPYASIFPLVTPRGLSRAFTYEVDDGVAKGAIVSIPFGRRRARGIVVALEEAAPAGIDVVPVDRVLGRLPPPLVDLALWLADYYGSTPGGAATPVSTTTPRADDRPKRIETTAPFPTPGGTS